MDKPIDLNDRAAGGPVYPARRITEPDGREVVVAFDKRPIVPADAGLVEALNQLGAAINQLAQAIVASFQPRETPADPGGSPGPAKGLTTQIRPTPDHRNPNHDSNFGFAPVKAEGHSQAPAPYQHHEKDADR